jgi:hypothetical protein
MIRLVFGGMSADGDCVLPWRVVMNQRVPGGGRNTTRGLVAQRDISPLEIITEFHVEAFYKTDMLARGEKQKYFVVMISLEKYARLSVIDVRGDFVARYNGKVGNLSNHICRSKANAKMIVHAASSSIKLRAEKLIRQGEDIFYNYGNQDWTSTFRSTKRANRRKFPNLKQGTAPPLKRRKKKA